MSAQPPIPPPPIPVLVCGESARGDDAAGFAALDLLAPATLAAARVEPVGQLDVLVLLDLPAESACVVVDAVYGLEPGEIWVRPLEALVDRARALDAGGRRPEPRSSHELPIDAVLTLAATLRAAPPRGVFVGIGGAEFGLGAPMSPAVAAALPAFAAAIDAAVVSLLTPATDRVAEAEAALALAGTEAPR
jgi:hydrogenase maturation protease